MIPFVDAHHHVWDPLANPHPWLAPGAAIAFRYGDYASLKRPYTFADHRRLGSGQNLVASVTMEGEWTPDRPVDEARWLAGLDRPRGLGSGHVSQAWLNAPDLSDVLGELHSVPFVKGVRHKPAVGPRGSPLSPGHPASLTDPAFRAGYAALAAHGLRFDLQAPFWALADAAELAERHPDVPIVLDHAGLPSDRSPEGIASWEGALRHFARVPHAFVKISGIGLADRPWTVRENAGIVLRTIDAFGPRRCMFASNFPVDGLCGTFDTIVGGYREIIGVFSQSEQRDMLHDVALRFYGIDIRID